MVRILLMLCLLFVVTLLINAQTVFIINGGDWSDSNNWTPKQKPQSTDSVIVNGVVTSNNSVSVRSLVVNGHLTIVNEKHLWVSNYLSVNYYLWVDTLECRHIQNTGTLYTNYLTIFGVGHIENKGNFNAIKINLLTSCVFNNDSSGTAEASFYRDLPYSSLLSEPILKIRGEIHVFEMNLGGNVLDATEARFGQGYFENTKIRGGDFWGIVSFMQGVSLYDSVTLYKPLILSDIHSYGTVVLTDSMLGKFTLSSSVSFFSHGIFINRGVVGGRKVSESGSSTLTMNIDSSLYNEGGWAPDFTNFTCSYRQSIWCGPSSHVGNTKIKAFSGEIDVLSSLRFLGTVDLDTTKFYFHGDTLFGDASGSIYGGKFIGNACLHGCTLSGSTFTAGSITITKKCTVSDVVINSTLVNNDTLVSNRGVTIYGTIVNNGYWNTAWISVKDSVIISNTGSFISGALTAETYMVQRSGFVMNGVFDISELELNSWRLYLYGGTLRNAMIKGANIYNGTLENCTITRNPSYGTTSYFHDSTIYRGKTIARFDIDISGTLVVYDSLMNDGLGWHGINSLYNYIAVHGNIINNGAIYNITLLPHSGMENNGTWTNLSTDFRGDTDKWIALAPGKEFRGAFSETNAFDPPKNITALTDLRFSGDVSLRPQTIIHTNGHSLSTPGSGKVSGGIFKGDCTLDGWNGSSNTFSEGHVVVSKKTKLNSATFYSTLTNNDTVTGASIGLYNDIINNGQWLLKGHSTVILDSLQITAGPGAAFEGWLSAYSEPQVKGISLNGTFNFDYYAFSNINVHASEATLSAAGYISDAKLYGATIKNTLLRNTTAYDSITFIGSNKVRHTLQVFGSFINQDSLVADMTEGNVEIKVEGPMANYGVLQGMPVFVKGDVFNYGIWTEKRTNMTGSNHRKIFLAEGRTFPGEFWRIPDDTAGIVFALSDLRFAEGKLFTLESGTLAMNGHSLTVPGILRGNVNGPVRFVGKNNAPQYLYVRDSVIVMDSMFMGGITKIFGPISNRGVLNGGGDAKFYSSIENKGTWNHPNTHLYVNKAQPSSLRLWNTSGTPLPLPLSTVTGSDAQYFKLTDGDRADTIPTGSFRQLAVRYVDTNTTLDHQAVWNIPSPNIGTLSTITLLGDTAGTSLIPLAAFSANGLHFGTVLKDSTAVRTLLVRNSRTNILSIDTVFAKAGRFSPTVTKRTSTAGDSAVINVSLTPSQYGAVSDTLIVLSNAFPYRHAFPLSAFVPAPQLSVGLVQWNFSLTAVGDSTQISAVIRNLSPNILSIDSIRKPSTLFHIGTLPPSISGNDSIAVSVRFVPLQFGTAKDSLVIYSNGGRAVLYFSGTSPFPSVSLSSAAFAFGQLRFNDTLISSVTLYNASINAAAVAAVRFRRQQFTLLDTPKVIGRNDSVKIRYRFVPAEFGSFVDTLELMTNGGNFIVRITGSSPKPELTAVAVQTLFGSVFRDSTRAMKVRFVNPSINTATVDSVRTRTKYFLPSGGPASVGKGDTLSITVSFTPDSARLFVDTLRVYGNSVQPIVVVALSGSGAQLTWVEQMRNMLPTVYALYQNYPNPFNPSTSIVYALPAESRVRLTVYNLLGQQVDELVNDVQPAGWQEVRWNGTASGIYFYRIDARGSDGRRFTEVKRMVLVR